MCGEDWLRSYDFQPMWSDHVEMAKYDNGSGNDMFIFFLGADAIIKGFDHESPVSPHASDKYAVWPGIYDNVPSELDRLLDDPAVARDDVTFCVWYSSGEWSSGTLEFLNQEDDGSSGLLGKIHMDVGSVQSIYSGSEITSGLIRRLNPDRDSKVALTEIAHLAEG